MKSSRASSDSAYILLTQDTSRGYYASIGPELNRGTLSIAGECCWAVTMPEVSLPGSLGINGGAPEDDLGLAQQMPVDASPGGTRAARPIGRDAVVYGQQWQGRWIVHRDVSGTPFWFIQRVHAFRRPMVCCGKSAHSLTSILPRRASSATTWCLITVQRQSAVPQM